jgi:homoserine kinase
VIKVGYRAKSVRAFAPGTVANVGSGFDIFGFALNNPGDEVYMSIKKRPGVHIIRITGDDGSLPKNAENNTAGVSVQAMLKYLNADFGVSIELNKQMPIGSGLGSSAASAVASIYALNHLLEKPLSKDELLSFAIEGEKITSGERVHLDNISACLYGGFILVRSSVTRDIVSIPTPDNLYCTIVHPRINIKTSESRRMLKNQISLNVAITQWGNAAGMIAALFKNDYDLLRRSLKDVVAEPVRSILIPFFQELNSAAMDSGALGCSISGSGPSVFALSEGKYNAEQIGIAFKSVLDIQGVENDIYISPINKEGPKIIQ